MTQKGKTIILVVVIIIVIWLGWMLMSQPSSETTIVPTATTSDTQATPTTSVAPKPVIDSSDTSISSDLGNIDTQVNGLKSDSANTVPVNK